MKWLSILTVLVLTACGSGGGDNLTDNGNDDETCPANLEFVTSETVTFDDGSILVVDYAVPQPRALTNACEEPPVTPPKPPQPPFGPTDPGCFRTLAGDTAWHNLPIHVVMDTRDSLIDPDLFKALFEVGMETWNAELPFSVWGDVFVGPVDRTVPVDLQRPPNGFNEVFWGPFPQFGVIAATWTYPAAGGYFETDMIYNTAMPFGTNGEANLFDFLGVTAHEQGHSLGLGHPNSNCTEETMFFSAGLGETKKRDLHAGDRAGILHLYIPTVVGVAK